MRTHKQQSKIIVNSEFIKRHSMAKRIAPDCSLALRGVKRVAQECLRFSKRRTRQWRHGVLTIIRSKTWEETYGGLGERSPTSLRLDGPCLRPPNILEKRCIHFITWSVTAHFRRRIDKND